MLVIKKILLSCLLFTYLSFTSCSANQPMPQRDTSLSMNEENAQNTGQIIEQSIKRNKTTSEIAVPNSSLEVHFIDVGQGDCTFISLPNGQTMLIDAGDKEYGDNIVSYIKNTGVKKIDYLIVSHPHADHIGGMAYVIDNMDIGSVYMPDIISTTVTFENLLTSIENKNLFINIAEKGTEVFKDENIKIVFIAPVEKSDDLNNMSAVLKITFMNTSFLFMGDAEKESEQAILKSKQDIQADVIKIGHHGSKTSSAKTFLKAVKPKYAVISCGENNKYGHPADTILNLLNELGINIYRTDETGTIVAVSDGENITLIQNQTKIMINAPPFNYSVKTEEKKETMIFVTNKGTKYHIENCKYLRASKNLISLEEARLCYTPCSVCKPPE